MVKEGAQIYTSIFEEKVPLLLILESDSIRSGFSSVIQQSRMMISLPVLHRRYFGLAVSGPLLRMFLLS